MERPPIGRPEAIENQEEPLSDENDTDSRPMPRFEIEIDCSAGESQELTSGKVNREPGAGSEPKVGRVEHVMVKVTSVFVASLVARSSLSVCWPVAAAGGEHVMATVEIGRAHV